MHVNSTGLYWVLDIFVYTYAMFGVCVCVIIIQAEKSLKVQRI